MTKIMIGHRQIPSKIKLCSPHLSIESKIERSLVTEMKEKFYYSSVSMV